MSDGLNSPGQVFTALRFETIGIEVGEDISTETMGNGQTAAADRPYFAAPAGGRTTTVAFGRVTLINILKAMLMNIADW